MRADALLNVTMEPECKFVKIAKTKVLMADEKNVSQMVRNVQNVVGLDNSYVKRAPPIGEPKAALTPAEAPAAMKVLFSKSF